MITWNAETVRRLAIGICDTEGITVEERHESNFSPCAIVRQRKILLGPFNLLNSKEYLWSMFHEIGHLFPENLWQDEALQALGEEVKKGKLHDSGPFVCNILMDHLADKSKLGEYPGRDRALTNGIYDFMVTHDFISEKAKLSPLVAALFAADLELRSDWQCPMPFSIPQDISHIYTEIIKFDLEPRLLGASKPKDLVDLTKDIMSLGPKAEKKKKKKEKEEEQKGSGGKQGKKEKQVSKDPMGDPGALSEEQKQKKPQFGRMPGITEPLLPDNQGSSYVPKRQWKHIDTRGCTDTSQEYKRLIESQLQGQSLSKKMRKYLLAMKQQAWVGGQKKGKLHRKNLYRLAVTPDNARIHRRKEAPRISQSSSIMVLTDCSGSMSGTRRVIASACAISLIEICQDLRMPVESRGFTDSNGDAIKDILFRGFSESPVSRDSLIERYSQRLPEAINADAESISNAHEIIYKRNEAKRLLIVLSDGSPTGGTKIGDRRLYLREILKHIHKTSAVDVFGIGIATDVVKKYYDNWAVVEKPEDLEGVIINLLKDYVTI